ncbi:MAG: hypothetical protein H7328_00595 [Bdellovibrio sp.]|nr:hypothetical protein [Bdellovibrio sp.]
MNLIKSAQKNIHLQTYIFETDSFGRRVHEELIRAAQRGLQVFVLADSVGSRKLSQESGQQMLDAGIHFCRFNGVQFKWLYQWGRRLHHKVLVIDHQKAFVGGINVTSACYDQKLLLPQLDFAVYLEGPVTFGLANYCQAIFKKACAHKIEFHPVVLKNCIVYPNGHELKISINDWVYRRWQITRQYSRLTKVAKKEITIVNSYFFPRRKFMKQLAKAAKRGVKVRLILPKVSDWPTYIKASQYLYAYFLKNGIEIYEWKKSILHGKLASIDGQWSTVGSFNLNYTSYQQNLEMNVNINSSELTQKINQQIQQIIDTGCEKINSIEFLERTNFREKVSRFFYYVILSLVANFSIGLIFQENENAKKNHFYKMLRVIGSVLLFIVGIIGIILPVMPGIPFLIVSFLLVYQQILSNNRDV